MVHCPECGTTLASLSDVQFTDLDSSVGFLKASKRYYEVNCADCGRSLGGGVAGAGGGGGGAAAGAGAM